MLKFHGNAEKEILSLWPFELANGPKNTCKKVRSGMFCQCGVKCKTIVPGLALAGANEIF